MTETEIVAKALWDDWRSRMLSFPAWENAGELNQREMRLQAAAAIHVLTGTAPASDVRLEDLRDAIEREAQSLEARKYIKSGKVLREAYSAALKQSVSA